MRQWKSRERPADDEYVPERPGPSAGRRYTSGADWQGAAAEGDWEDEWSAGRSDGRRRRRGAEEYPDVDLERALVPTGQDLMPMQQGMGALAVPGMPATDEEERALGIRRPVYIPATGERRKRQLGTWRVVSGVLSILLVCVASCGLAGFLGRAQLERVLPGAIKTNLQAPTIALTQVPKTPVATAGPAANIVTSAVTARAVDAQRNPVDVTSYFEVNSTVFVVVTVRNAPAGQHTLSVQWYLQGVDVQLTGNAQTSYTQDKWDNSNAFFSLRVPMPGVGTAKIYWDVPATAKTDAQRAPALAQTINFAVLSPTPTPVPTKATPKPGTPSPQGTKTGLIGPPPVAWRAECPQA